MRANPNVLCIIADDLGCRDLGCEGSSFYESPNIDRIAGGGMRFTNGYANCQVCSPSRASILTGRYTPRHGVTDWIGAKSGEAWREAGRHTRLLPPDYSHSLGSHEITLADAFRGAGYRTFFAGKWHLGGPGSYPEDHGFEVNIGGWEAGSPHGGYFAPYGNPRLPDGPAGESLPLRLARETNQFIEQHRSEPFFAFLSFYSVHGPIQTNEERWRRFRNKARPATHRFLFDRRLPVRQIQDCPVYGGMIAAMDDAVGMVLDTLDRLSLTDDTIVCFTSDNGGVSSGDSYSTSNLPFRGGKGRQWEGGIREPFHIVAPGITTPGTVCDIPVSGIDFSPTLLDLSGVTPPDGPIVDGRSLVPLLAGSGVEQLSERDLFWHYRHCGNQGGTPGASVRKGDWKLIRFFEDGRGGQHEELYDLRKDLGETTNLADTEPAKREELSRLLTEWAEEIEAVEPTPNPD